MPAPASETRPRPASARSRRSGTKPVGEPTLWYKDAIIYQAHVKAYCDSNGDGIGDLPGLLTKLDYLQSLGITALWLLPFYPSPQRDDGYDIADYYNIHPSYGTLQDFKNLLKEAHRRGLRVITELVINHTSDQHPWFQRARRAPRGSIERDYYVWNDTPDKYPEVRIIFKDFEPSNWTFDNVAGQYYWHRFFHHQPDLNFDSPHVRRSIFKMLDFWFEMGVDGLRLDAIPYLFEREGTDGENLPETHAYLKELRAHVDRKFPDAMLLAEACQWPEDVVAYFGDGPTGNSCHMAFHFPVMPRMFMALQMEDRYPIIDILEQTPAIPSNCQWAIFLRNHDELTLEMVTDEERDYMYRVYANDPRARINLGIRRRLSPLLGNNRRKIELINILLMSLPGTPIIYYGDEIGMGDNIYLGDRNGVRTPMQWSADRNAGFSRANPQQLFLPVIIDPEYQYEAINVENQERNLSSMLYWMRRVIAMRRRYTAFGRGTTEFLPSDNSKLLTFVRKHGDETILVIVNLSRFAQAVELDLEDYAGTLPRELFSQNVFPRVRAGAPYVLTLGPHGHYWLLLESENAAGPGSPMLPPAGAERPLPSLGDIPGGWLDLMAAAVRTRLERAVLPGYLPACRWFRSKSRRIASVNIARALPLADDAPDAARLLWLTVSYGQGLPETYLLPAAIARGEPAARLRAERPRAVLAALGEDAVLFDATYDPAFQSALLAFVAGRGRSRGENGGELLGVPGKALKGLLDGTKPGALTSHLLGAEQSNSAVLYEDRLFLKLYRLVEEGENPDIELTRFLTERRDFAHVPPFAGVLEFRPAPGSAPVANGGREPQVVALLQGAVAAESDGWTLTVDSAARYFERVLEAHADAAPPAPGADTGARLMDADFARMPEAIQTLVGAVYPERAALLGQRTGELHLALASDDTDPAFRPEPFNLMYQRSLLQSLHVSQRRALMTVRRVLPGMDEATRGEVEALLSREKEMAAVPTAVLRTGRVLEAMKTRVHGDYHLGQVLFTGKDFTLIDFEGEPARPMGERKLKRCPLVDVAGMVRSFHYAAHGALLLGKVNALPEVAAALRPWAELWYRLVSGSFLRAYVAAVAGAQPAFVPTDPADFDALLRAFLLDKAVYEVGYEVNNRPAWLPIPLRGVSEVLGG